MNVRLWDFSLWGREEEEAADSSESALLFFKFFLFFESAFLEQLSVGT